jgi:hypothetical protein
LLGCATATSTVFGQSQQVRPLLRRVLDNYIADPPRKSWNTYAAIEVVLRNTIRNSIKPPYRKRPSVNWLTPSGDRPV